MECYIKSKKTTEFYILSLGPVAVNTLNKLMDKLLSDVEWKFKTMFIVIKVILFLFTFSTGHSYT